MHSQDAATVESLGLASGGKLMLLFREVDVGSLLDPLAFTLIPKPKSLRPNTKPQTQAPDQKAT